MRRFLLVLLVLGFPPRMAFAKWAYVPMDVLIQESDLIVVGTLTGVSQYSKDDMDYGEGAILVDEVIWGDISPGDMLTLRWQNSSHIVCPRVEHKYAENKKGIWLLTADGEREVRANYPGRFVELKKTEEVKKILLRKKICLRTERYVISPGEPAKVAIVFRNPTQDEISFPGVEYTEGNLRLSPGVKLKVSSGWGEEEIRESFLPDRVTVSENIPPIIVEGMQERRITLNLDSLLNISPDRFYIVHFSVKGYDPANKADLYSQSPRSEKQDDDGRTKSPDDENKPAGESSQAQVPILILVGAVVLLTLRRRAKN